ATGPVGAPGDIPVELPPIEDAVLGRARRLIADAIRRRWDEGLIARDPDGVFTSFLGAEHVEKLMQGPGGRAPLAPLDGFEVPPGTPLGRLAARLRLTPTQVDLLA